MNSPFSYAEIAGRYDANPQLSDLGLSLNDYSELGNYFTGSNNFDQGTGNWFTNAAKRFAYEKNQWLDENARPVLDFTGNVGEKLFSFFGADPATGREVGEGLVGQTVDFLPAIAGYGLAAIPGVGSFSIPIGNALSGAMAGATALEQSDSYGQAGVMAALPFVAPGISSFGAKAAFEGIAEPLGKTAVGKFLGMGGAEVGGKVVTKSIADKLTAFLGSEVAIGSAVEGASWAVSALEGDPYNPFTKENVLANVLETVMMPFSYAELIHGTEIRDAAVKQVRQEKATDQADAEQLVPIDTTLAPTPQGTLTTSYLSALNEVDSIPDSAMRAKAKHAVEALHQKLREEAAPTDSTIESLFKGEVETVMKEASQVVTDEGEGGVVVDPSDSPVETESVMDGNVRYFQGVVPKPDPFKGVIKTELGEGFESMEVYLKDKDVYLREVADNGEVVTRSYVDKRGNEFYQDFRRDNLWVEGPDAKQFALADGRFDQEKLKQHFTDKVFPSLSRRLAKLKTLGKPRNLREAQEQVITVNQVREEQNLEPVTDKGLTNLVEREMEAGATVEEAVQTAISQIKEETKKVASGTGRVSGGRKKKPYSSEEVTAAQTEIDALVTSSDKTVRKLAIEGLKVITKRTELERYMRNATKAVHEFIQAYQKNQELGSDPSKLAELNGLSKNELQTAGYLTSRGELVLKDEDALVAWNRLKFTLERLSERFDVPTTTLAKDDGTKAFDTREEAEKFAMRHAEKGARVVQAGGKKKVDGSKGEPKWYVRVPQRDSQVDVNTVAGKQAVEIAEKVFAQDAAAIDTKDKAVADEVRDDRLEELLRIAEVEFADDKSYNAELVRELAQVNPEAAKMALEARLAELDAEDVKDMFNQSADWATATKNFMVDFPETDGMKFFSKDYVLHQVRSVEDIPEMLTKGLRAGTNLSRADVRGNQSLMGDAMLIFRAAGLPTKEKGYNKGDLLLQRGVEAKPEAIAFDEDELPYTPEIRREEVMRRLDAVEAEIGKAEDAMNAAKAAGLDYRELERQWLSLSYKADPLVDQLIKLNEANTDYLPDTAEQEHIKRLRSAVGTKLPIYAYSLDESARVRTMRLVSAGEVDSEFADFPPNVTRAIQNPAKNNGLHTSIGDVLGVSTDGKQTQYIGNKSIQKNIVNGHIDETFLAARLQDAGVSKSVWEAYKLAYPKMAEGGKVNMWWLREAGVKGLVEVDVHGGRSHYEVANQRMGEIRHEFDTKYREFDFSDVRAVAIEGYVYGNDALTDKIKKFLDSNPEVIDLAGEFDSLLKSSYAAANGQSDFAQRYGSIAPDNFEPFDPTTGLGNVAYELRAPGVKGGGPHTGNEDTLAWVRGKFVEKDGKKVFRVDEVQSDAAQRWSKFKAMLDSAVSFTEEPMGRYTTYVLRDANGGVVDRVNDVTKPGITLEGVKSLAHESHALIGHPLFDSYESMALRVAIEKARENGAEEIFLPDGETAMMSEGHDRAATRTVSPNQSATPATMIQVMFHNYPVTLKSVEVNSEGKLFYSLEDQATKEVNVIPANRLGIGLSTRDYSYLMDWAESVLSYDVLSPSQSKGMTDAYDRRLPQTTAKLLGEKGERTVLGTHKNGPSPVFKEQEPQTLAVWEGSGQTPGKSTVTGLTYSLAGKGFDESGAGQFTITPSLPALMERTLIKAGFTQEQVGEVKPFFEALNKTLNLDDVKFGELLTEAKKGSATIDGNLRLMLLSSKDLQGLSLEEATQQLSLVAGHEIGHLTEHLYRKNMLDDVQSKAFKDAVDWTTKASAEEKQLAFEVLRDGTLPESMRNHPILAEMQRSFDKPEEFRAHLMSIWAMGQTFKSPDQQFAFGLLPKPVARFFKLLTDMAWKMYGSVRSVLHNAPGFGSWDARHRAYKLKEMMTSLRDAQWKNEVVMKDFEGIGMVGPEARASFEGRAKDLYGQSRTLDEFMRFFDPEDDQKSVIPEPRNALLKQAERLFVQGDQLAAAVPELKNVFNALHSFTANTKAMTKRAAGKLTGGVDASGNPYWTRDGQMSWERVQLDKHPRNNKLLGDWMRLQQSTVSEVFDPATGETKQIRGAGIELDKLSKHDRALADKINQLPKADRDAIVDMRNRFTEFMSQLQTDTLTHFKESVTTNIAGYLAMRMPESYGDVHKIANSLFTATLRIRAGDTVTGQALMNQAASMFKDATVFNNALDIATRGYDNWMKLTQFFAERPWFFSEIRNGKVLLKWTEKDGTSGSLGFKDRKDAQAYEKQLIDRGIPRSQISAPELTRGQAHFEVEPEWLTAVAQMEVEAKQQIDNMSDLTPEQKDLLKSEHAYAAEFQRAFASHEVFKPGSNRKLSAGREDLDMVSTQIAYANAASRAINRKVLTQSLIHAYANPKLKDPKLADYVAQSKQMVKNFMTADTELGRAISTTNAAYFLGLNMSSHIVELGQGAFTFVPEMVNQGMGYFESNVAMFKAQMQVAKFYAKHLPKKAGQVVGMNVKDDNKIWNNPDIEDLMNWAATRDLVSLTHASDIVDVDVSSTADLTTLAVKGPKGLVKKAFSPVKAFANTSLKLYQQFTEFNARTALLLGYQMGKKKGMTHVEAREHAAQFARTVTFSGGKANRPEMLFSNEGSFRTAGQAAYSLQGYTFGVLSMMWRYAQTGYNKKQFPNMSEAERAHARKALKTMVATQFAGAGLLGMPFVGPAMAMVEEFSDAEPFMDIRLALAELFNEDDEEGGLLSDIVMYGAANAFANKLLPGAPDFQSRYAIGTVMGLNPYTGFSLDQLAGPTGSIVRNIGAGLKAITLEGDFERAVGEWAPVSFKKYLDLQRNDGELTDARTNTRIEANGEEKFLYAIGFTPQRIRKMKDVASAQYRHEEVQTRKDVRWHDDIADLYLRDPRAAAAKIRQRAIEDDAFSAQAAMNKVAERVEKRTFAMDPRRESSKRGSAGIDALMRSMGVTSEATEMDRLNLRQQVMQSLGGIQPPSQTAYRRAMMIDQLMQANPYMTRSQAMMQVDLQLSRRA